ncbi:MAG: single-stranded DNA-binding protein [Bacillota bacterium]|nr:single-stranded DNA-binding protein [Bacillota bacterium]MDD3298008.1 single-stranded DNA-binding protein [Bacillota bacterium]MDD3850039.1 single-stranded DNA-binding protein [Bacillota bacterium]MDD4706724.1 single-stranded DNA-binding protein [Bacillota bacterium]
MMNKVCLVGRLTRDPELRVTPGTGTQVATFTLAVGRNYKNRQGERETDFIRIVTWRKLAELCATYLGKGRLAGVTGRIQTRSWEDDSGQRRSITEVVADEVVFLDKAPGTGGAGESKEYNRDKDGSDDDFYPIEEDSDLPF